MVTDPYRVVEVPFTLNIGKDLKTIEFVEMDAYFPYIQEDGSILFYHPVVSVNCSQENPCFYSENGRLYDWKTGGLISVFPYTDAEPT